MGWESYEWRPYVSVAKKLASAVREAARLTKKQGRVPAPVKLQSRKITTTFWGNSWCQNLEAYSDFANRLPRGARYVRNGSVVDLLIKRGCIEAIVAGSEVYTVNIKIASLTKAAWSKIRRDCSSSIDSLLDLLAGRFSDGVMQRLTRQKDGLFPAPREIEMACSCPDWSECCKHIAAVMYGVGARLDSQPELLFLLRDVDHQELVSQAVDQGNLEKELSAAGNDLAGRDLGEIFGIELDTARETGSPSNAGLAANPATMPAKSATPSRRSGPKTRAVRSNSKAFKPPVKRKKRTRPARVVSGIRQHT
jgi:uncharacterized Zn finger protein